MESVEEGRIDHWFGKWGKQVTCLDQRVNGLVEKIANHAAEENGSAGAT
jgi:hypothetical protein